MHTLITLPSVVLKKIFSFLTFDEVARLRIVNRDFDQLGRDVLNLGLLRVEKYQTSTLKEFRSQLPRRESERRVHRLARHIDVLMTLETRISMLSMTYMKYIDAGLACFIPGKVLDEMFRILWLIRDCNLPPRPHELLQELRDISSMAMEHFDEKIAPDLKAKLNSPLKILPKSCRQATQQAVQHLNDIEQSMKKTKDHFRSMSKEVKSIKTKVREHKRQLAENTTKIAKQKRQIAENAAKITEQENQLTEMRKWLEEKWDAEVTSKITKLTALTTQVELTLGTSIAECAAPPKWQKGDATVKKAKMEPTDEAESSSDESSTSGKQKKRQLRKKPAQVVQEKELKEPSETQRTGRRIPLKRTAAAAAATVSEQAGRETKGTSTNKRSKK